jgi:hypothetical protein
MKYNRTTFVLGAGASKAIEPEFGLGKDLIEQIFSRLKENVIQPTLSKNQQIKLPFKKYIIALENYLSLVENPSIDQFMNEINTFPEFDLERNVFNEITKSSITLHIVGYEGQITTNFKNNTTQKYENTWIYSLIQFLKDKEFFSDKRYFEKLRFVIFNYDRVLEYFLLQSFPDEIENVLYFINRSVIHPYGSIKKITSTSSQNPGDFGVKNDNKENLIHDNYSLQYEERGSETNTNMILSKYFISSIENSQKHCINHYPEWVDNSDQQVCFMGFAFDFLNCKFLNLSHTYLNKPSYYTNIHPARPDAGFSKRRKMIDHLLNIRPDAKISFLNANDFVSKRLEQFDPTAN